TTPLSLSPSFLPFLSLSVGGLRPLSSEDACFSTYSSQSDSQYGSPLRGWSEEMDEHGHTLYVSDYTNEKVPTPQSRAAVLLLWCLGLHGGNSFCGSFKVNFLLQTQIFCLHWFDSNIKKLQLHLFSHCT
ncbi:hypothetical protein XENOCAPTIV_001949, partial [Xenoophorus captivus]